MCEVILTFKGKPKLKRGGDLAGAQLKKNNRKNSEKMIKMRNEKHV